MWESKAPRAISLEAKVTLTWPMLWRVEFLLYVWSSLQVDFPMEGSDIDPDAEWKPLVPKISTSWGHEMPEFSRVGAKARGKSSSTTSLDIGETKEYFGSQLKT